MAYPLPILRKERKILEIVERGHPERRMTAHTRQGSGQVDALEWSEIQVASGMPFNEFADCIAHLVANDMIQSGTEHPGFVGSLFGKERRLSYGLPIEAELSFKRIQKTQYPTRSKGQTLRT